jgi:hypothetical protein
MLGASSPPGIALTIVIAGTALGQPEIKWPTLRPVAAVAMATRPVCAGTRFESAQRYRLFAPSRATPQLVAHASERSCRSRSFAGSDAGWNIVSWPSAATYHVPCEHEVNVLSLPTSLKGVCGEGHRKETVTGSSSKCAKAHQSLFLRRPECPPWRSAREESRVGYATRSGKSSSSFRWKMSANSPKPARDG